MQRNLLEQILNGDDWSGHLFGSREEEAQQSGSEDGNSEQALMEQQ